MATQGSPREDAVLGTRSLVGRARELAQLTAALAQARAGRGGLWLISGEPGIGKSRCVEELSRIAAEHEMSVLWGRAWEVGGAPSYWPFIQALRVLLRAGEPSTAELIARNAAGALVELLPELRSSIPDGFVPAATLEPEQARFRLMDAVSRVLCDAARATPSVLILEDLHAADPASIALLQLLAQQAPQSALLIVGTLREAELLRNAAGELLARLAQRAERITLARLERREVDALLARSWGREPDSALGAAVFAATEGNPLFVGEIARLHDAQRAHGTQAKLVIPPSVKSAIRERLATLTPEARAVLGLAAVIGREHTRSALARLSGLSEEALEQALEEHVASEIVSEIAPGVFRFSHVLLREVAYAELPAQERERAHAAFAAELERTPDALAERAHHLLRAGASARDDAVRAAEAAGQRAVDQYAYAEAAGWYKAALDAAEHTERMRCRLLLALGRSQLLAHELAAGTASCRAACTAARALGDAALLAHAALALGVVLRVGEVMPELVEALREALAALPERDDPLRAKVMARLAAAQQPAHDPAPPIAMAREAIAMARRSADPLSMLEVIRSACSAMIDMAPPAECAALCREHAQLAAELHSEPDAFRAQLRLAFCSYELSDLAQAHASVEACQRLAHRLGDPRFAWRAEALQVMRAMFAGRFDAALALLASARALAERVAVPDAQHTLMFQRVTLLDLQGRGSELKAALPELERSLPRGSFVHIGVAVWIGAALLRAGDRAAALERWRPYQAELRRALADVSMFDALAYAAIELDDRALIDEVYAFGKERIGSRVAGGVFAMTWDMPVRRGVAQLAAARGAWDEARREYDALFVDLRTHGARPHLAWALYEHGEACLERGERERARGLLEEAQHIAEAIDMTSTRIAAALARCRGGELPAVLDATDPSRTLAFRMRQEGEYWSIEREGRAFRLKEGKGLSMLARLVEEPGRELHVLDLAGALEHGAVDGGDAGELLDAKARSAYERRVQVLRDELAEAEREGDERSVARAREELDAIAQELARAVGMGGRERRAGSATERARVNVQRRLRDALARIREHDEELGRHLGYTIRTGTYCSYLRG